MPERLSRRRKAAPAGCGTGSASARCRRGGGIMATQARRRDWGRIVTWLAILLGIGSVAAAFAAAFGAGHGMWHFRIGFAVLKYVFFAAAAGAVVGLVGLVMTRRRPRLMLVNLLALVVALGFVLFLGNLVRTAKSVPAIHDVTTNLDDVPQF